MSNKKSLALLIGGAMIIAVAVATYFFFGRSSDAYANTIPHDATAIVRLNATEFLRDAKLSPQELWQWLHPSQSAALPTENPDIQEDSYPAGIDLRRPVYAFSAPSGNLGISAAISNKDDLEAYCKSAAEQGAASEITRQRGYSWVVFKQQWLLAFDSETALMMGPATGSAQEQLRTEMSRLLGQEREDSGTESPLFAALTTSDDPLTAIVAPEILPAGARRYLRSLKVASKDDALLHLSLETDDNELQVEAKILARSEEVQAQLRRIDRLLRPIKGQLIDKAHSENVAWIAFNVEGAELLDALRENNAVRTALLALNLAFDLDRIIRSVDGDVALELTSASALLSGGDWTIPTRDFFITAQVASTDFLSGASTWGNSLFGVRALSPQDFCLNYGANAIYFGVDGRTFYLGADQGLANGKNEYLSDERGDIADSRLYATFDIATLLSQQGVASFLPPALTIFRRMNLEMEQADEFKCKLIAPSGTNIVREIIRGR